VGACISPRLWAASASRSARCACPGRICIVSICLKCGYLGEFSQGKIIPLSHLRYELLDEKTKAYITKVEHARKQVVEPFGVCPYCNNPVKKPFAFVGGGEADGNCVCVACLEPYLIKKGMHPNGARALANSILWRVES
jgi:hypothetical protein